MKYLKLFEGFDKDYLSEILTTLFDLYKLNDEKCFYSSSEVLYFEFERGVLYNDDILKELKRVGAKAKVLEYNASIVIMYSKHNQITIDLDDAKTETLDNRAMMYRILFKPISSNKNKISEILNTLFDDYELINHMGFFNSGKSMAYTFETGVPFDTNIIKELKRINVKAKALGYSVGIVVRNTKRAGFATLALDTINIGMLDLDKTSTYTMHNILFHTLPNNAL